MRMNYSVYTLLNLDEKASPNDVLLRCQQYLSSWNLRAIEQKLRGRMSPEEATVCAQRVFRDGELYLKSIATMLLDPSSRQCYDAWIDAQISPTPEKRALTRARLSWFNGQSSTFAFADTMLSNLKSEEQVQLKRSKKRKFSCKPLCRKCEKEFSFQEPYLVLHCHCTTRVGHASCMQEVATEINNKCPVCRQRLLHRHQVSKYLFWNVKEKFKFIS